NPDAKRDLRSTPERRGTQARGTPVVVRMSLVGAALKPLLSGREELPGKANYLIGKDPAKWRTNVPTYAKVHYRAVYPGITLVYATYLGGSISDDGYGIAVDAAGSAYVTGLAGSTDFPTASPLQAAYGGGGDAFVSKLNAAGSALLYSTYLGGSGEDYGYGI